MGGLIARERHSDLSRLRVLIPSSRQASQLVSYGTVVDFEDAVAAVSDADIVTVPVYSRRAQIAGALRGHRPRLVTPPRSQYDVCLLVAMAPYRVPSLRYIRDLRRIAKRVVVYLYDAWPAELERLSAHRGEWDLVDELFVSFAHTVSAYGDTLNKPVHYLPQAIAPRWFSPFRLERPIDVLSVGRRVPQIHSRLIAVSQRRDWFYLYQDVVRPHSIDLRESQALLGSICQRARVQVSWSVEHTRADRVDDSCAVTLRWFEAAASGSVVVGKAPTGDEFGRLFPYPGFVHDLTPGAPTDAVEQALDGAFADRRFDERRTLAEHVLATHNWEMRWRELVALAGIE